MASKDYYAILMVHHKAERFVIEAAYKRLAREYHPDVSNAQSAHQRMVDINEAYEVLSDPVRRKAYDETYTPHAGSQSTKTGSVNVRTSTQSQNPASKANRATGSTKEAAPPSPPDPTRFGIDSGYLERAIEGARAWQNRNRLFLSQEKWSIRIAFIIGGIAFSLVIYWPHAEVKNIAFFVGAAFFLGEISIRMMEWRHDSNLIHTIFNPRYNPNPSGYTRYSIEFAKYESEIATVYVSRNWIYHSNNFCSRMSNYYTLPKWKAVAKNARSCSRCGYFSVSPKNLPRPFGNGYLPNQESTSTKGRQRQRESPPSMSALLRLSGNWRAWTLIMVPVVGLFCAVLFRQFSQPAKSSMPAPERGNIGKSSTGINKSSSLSDSTQLSPALGELDIDLNEFRLLQSKKAVETTLGSAFKRQQTKRSEAHIYLIDEDAYMVFEYSKKDPYHISSIQLTGRTNKVVPFKGLVLGDEVQKVNRILGKPAKIMPVESSSVSKYEYDRGNYSLEIDQQGRLYSIRLFMTKELITLEGDSEKDWQEFKAAIISKDLTRLINMLRPDIEIYRDGKTLAVNEKYSDFIGNPDKEILDVLVGNTDSVLQEVTQTEPERELRLTEDFGIGEVYKFYKGKILAEIVFFPYNGRYCVYEIMFRNGKGK